MNEDRSRVSRRSGAGGGVEGPRSFDRADLRILELLREDGRVAMSELASHAGLSRSSAYIRLGRLVDGGVVGGFSARVDSGKLGLGITALIFLSVRQTDWRSLAEAIRSFPEVEWFGFLTGGFDAMLVVRVPDIATLRDVVLERLQALHEVRSTQTAFVLDEVVHRPYVLPSARA